MHLPPWTLPSAFAGVELLGAAAMVRLASRYLTRTDWVLTALSATLELLGLAWLIRRQFRA